MYKLNIEEYCNSPAPGGISEAWIAQRTQLGRFWKYIETRNYQYGIIDGPMSPISNNPWNKLLINRNLSLFTQLSSNVAAPTFTQSLTLQFNKQTVISRDNIESMIYNKPCLIFKDYSGQWWLIGETNGCRVIWESFTSQKGGVNGYSVIFTAVERFPIRSVSENYINSIINPTLESLCESSWTQLCNLSWAELCEAPW